MEFSGCTRAELNSAVALNGMLGIPDFQSSCAHSCLAATEVKLQLLFLFPTA